MTYQTKRDFPPRDDNSRFRQSQFPKGDLPQDQEEQPDPQYSTRRKIAVYGGSFDPIHNGHILVANKIVELGLVDEVLFVPTLNHPHKKKGLAASAEHRLNMLRLALEPYKQFSFTDIEIAKADEPSYTIDTITTLTHVFTDCELFLLIGMDCLANLHTWHRATELVQRNKFIIYPRPQCLPPPIFELQKRFGAVNAHKLMGSIVQDPELELSTLNATEIRNAEKNKLSIEKFVPEAVDKYIQEHKIYSR